MGMRLGLAVLGGMLVAGSAQARDPRPGTFLLAEVDAGFGLGDAFAEGPTGLATGLTFGAGGKPKGWPLRFFGIMRLSWASLDAEVETRLERSTIEREVFGYCFGLRIIAPIEDRLRFLSDVMVGGTQITSQATLGDGAERIASDDGSFMIELAFGLQYRLHYNFSIGARMDVAIPTGLDAFDALAETAGVSSNEAGAANLDWALTATLHF